MDKIEKEILKKLIKKELKCLKEDQEDVSLPLPNVGFIKSMDAYEEKLKELLKELK